jgi:hypothetical protein
MLIELYCECGRQDGHDIADWLAADRERNESRDMYNSERCESTAGATHSTER